MANRTRLPFKKSTWTGTVGAGDVAFYVNTSGDLVRRDSDGTETVIGASDGDGSAAVEAHEEAADPHTQYLTADA